MDEETCKKNLDRCEYDEGKIAKCAPAEIDQKDCEALTTAGVPAQWAKQCQSLCSAVNNGAALTPVAWSAALNGGQQAVTFLPYDGTNNGVNMGAVRCEGTMKAASAGGKIELKRNSSNPEGCKKAGGNPNAQLTQEQFDSLKVLLKKDQNAKKCDANNCSLGFDLKCVEPPQVCADIQSATLDDKETVCKANAQACKYEQGGSTEEKCVAKDDMVFCDLTAEWTSGSTGTTTKCPNYCEAGDISECFFPDHLTCQTNTTVPDTEACEWYVGDNSADPSDQLVKIICQYHPKGDAYCAKKNGEL